MISSCGIGIAIIFELSKIPSSSCSQNTTQNNGPQQDTHLRTITIDGQTYQLKPVEQTQNQQELTLETGSQRNMVPSQESTSLNYKSRPQANITEAEINEEKATEDSVSSTPLPSPPISISSDSLSSYDINDYNSIVSAIKSRSLRNVNNL